MANYSTRVIVTLDFDHIPEREEIENTLLDIINENNVYYLSVLKSPSRELLKHCVSKNPWAIKYMNYDDQDEELCYMAVTYYGTNVTSGSAITHLIKPDNLSPRIKKIINAE